jgi:hypothetical protein
VNKRVRLLAVEAQLLLKSGVLTVVKPRHNRQTDAEEKGEFEKLTNRFFHVGYNVKRVYLRIYSRIQLLNVVCNKKRNYLLYGTKAFFNKINIVTY